MALQSSPEQCSPNVQFIPVPKKPHFFFLFPQSLKLGRATSQAGIQLYTHVLWGWDQSGGVWPLAVLGMKLVSVPYRRCDWGKSPPLNLCSSMNSW